MRRACRPCAGRGRLCWLLSRGYATVSALKLVGDRLSLTERQRQAVRRSACSDAARARRLERICPESDLAGCDLLIDGFNVLTTIEAALGGAVVLSCRDETYRDIAGLHGTYRRVAETMPSISLLGATISGLNIRRCRWLFDRPVSNSGRIRASVSSSTPQEHRLRLARSSWSTTPTRS